MAALLNCYLFEGPFSSKTTIQQVNFLAIEPFIRLIYDIKLSLRSGFGVRCLGAAPFPVLPPQGCRGSGRRRSQ